jgi:putrescine transport system ATP-binding protein
VSTAPDAIVWAAVRPEKIMITREEPAPAPLGVPESGDYNAAPGVIKEIAYMGDTSIFIVLLDSGKQVRITQPNTHRHADDPLTWEERVWISWHESSAVVVTE